MSQVANNIATNLQRFGKEDFLINVSARKSSTNELVMLRSAVKLTQLLAAGSNLWNNGPGDFFPTNLLISKDGEQIGWVDDDARFHYSKAPDLATFLAYAVACDGGRHRVLYSFSPTGAAKQLQLTLTPLEGVDEPSFEQLVRCHKQFKRCLARQFVYEKTTRFGDGHLGYISNAWKIATRDRFGNSIKSPVYYT